MWGDGDPTAQGSDLTRVVHGADRFVLANGSGRDTIHDFEPGRDRLDLAGYRGIDGFAAIRSHAAQSDAGTMIDLGAAAGGPGGRDVLILAGTAPATLDAADFLLG